jgi:hypothetical protein
VEQLDLLEVLSSFCFIAAIPGEESADSGYQSPPKTLEYKQTSDEGCQDQLKNKATGTGVQVTQQAGGINDELPSLVR